MAPCDSIEIELMKTLLVAALVMPGVSWAQSQLAPRLVKPTLAPTLAEVLTNCANPRYLRLPAGTFLYRQLRDTVGNHYASPLPAGDWRLDVVGYATSRWAAVRWRKGSAESAADTATFYMPKAALKGAQTMVEI